jgi:hypothetical protein
MPPLRLALFLGVMFPLLGALAYCAGFEKRLAWRDAMLRYEGGLHGAHRDGMA